MIELDSSQKEIAYKPYNTPQLVMAGPGRGKTELVAQRILYLVEESGLTPSELLILSFSRSAVRTLNNRLRSLDPLPPGSVEELRHISIRTFDSWTYRMLRFLGYTIADCLSRGYDANIELLSHNLENRGLELLQDNHPCGLHRVKHIIVDEVQDLSGVRAELVLRLLKLVCSNSRKDKGFTLLGDENQAIYDFAYRETQKGLTALEFLEETRRIWENSLLKSELTHNYRCEPPVDAVIKKAANILRRSHEQGQDPLPALKKLLDEIQLTNIDKVLNTSKTTAILCRNNGQALIQEANILSESNSDMAKRFRVHAGSTYVRLPYWIGALLSLYNGQAPLTKRTVQKMHDALVLRGLRIPYDASQLWNMLVNIMRSPENSTIPMNDLVARLRWPDSLPDDDYENENNLVLLTTIHQSKGQEFDNVLILRDGVAENIHDDCDVAEEGRITYVAVSRARSSLSCIVDASDVRLGKRYFNQASRERWFGRKVTEDSQRPRFFNYLEIGIPGDLNEASFVDPALHGGQDEVKKLQFFLAEKAVSLQGEKVLLKKRSVKEDGILKVYYDLYLDSPPDKVLLGTCSTQLGKDLAYLRPNKNLSLPGEIKGLRISQVYTFISDSNGQAGLAEPFCKSGIWLCVSIHGIGQYEYFFPRRRR